MTTGSLWRIACGEFLFRSSLAVVELSPVVLFSATHSRFEFSACDHPTLCSEPPGLITACSNCGWHVVAILVSVHVYTLHVIACGVLRVLTLNACVLYVAHHCMLWVACCRLHVVRARKTRCQPDRGVSFTHTMHCSGRALLWSCTYRIHTMVGCNVRQTCNMQSARAHNARCLASGVGVDKHPCVVALLENRRVPRINQPQRIERQLGRELEEHFRRACMAAE
jgi:hypothetical protein